MKKITRRSFLAAMGIVGASAALTACGGSSASSVASSTATSATASTAAGSAAAKPDGYPNTSMTLVVGFGAGGDTDLNNRLMAQYVEPSFGQSIAVTNMAGSNGSVAMTQYQSTPTDGYTIIGANTSAVVNNFASGTCQYSYKDYEVIAVFGRGAGEMLFANKQSGITSMEDLSAAKKGFKAGDTVTLTVLRDGKEITTQLTFDAQPQTTDDTADSSQSGDNNYNNGNNGYSGNGYSDLYDYFFGRGNGGRGN